VIHLHGASGIHTYADLGHRGELRAALRSEHRTRAASAKRTTDRRLHYGSRSSTFESRSPSFVEVVNLAVALVDVVGYARNSMIVRARAAGFDV